MFVLYLGEKMTDDEVNELLQGHEDAQGNVNYDGTAKIFYYVLRKCLWSLHVSMTKSSIKASQREHNFILG